MKKLLPLLVLTASLHAQSKWASFGPDGKLHYASSPTGDHIPDFSQSGYEAGGVALPHVATAIKLSPSGKDDTAAIQQAIDKVSAMPLKDNFRGAVELNAGTFHCDGTLHISASGVVLRGAGQNATTIEMTGDPHKGIELAGKLTEEPAGASTYATDAYIPFGAKTIHVADAKDLHPGDIVRITKPVTPEWVAFMGMDKLSRPGREEHWIGNDHLTTRRRIAAINGNAVTLEVALMDNYDAKFFAERKVTVESVHVKGQIDHVAVESLHLKAPARSIPLDEPHFDGIFLRDAADAWVRDVELEDVTNGLSVESGTVRVTVEHVNVTQHKPITSSAKNFQFMTNGQQILLDHITGTGNSVFYFATQARQQGPVVVLHCHFDGDGRIEPHQRWASGLLVDNCEVPHGGIDMINRGIMGSGHGWTIGWPVVWNSSAQFFIIQQAPGTLSWSIGNHGEQREQAMPTAKSGSREHNPPLPHSIIESQNKPVKPKSLYLEQLYERLGTQALKNIGYGDKDR